MKLNRLSSSSYLSFEPNELSGGSASRSTLIAHEHCAIVGWRWASLTNTTWRTTDRCWHYSWPMRCRPERTWLRWATDIPSRYTIRTFDLTLWPTATWTAVWRTLFSRCGVNWPCRFAFLRWPLSAFWVAQDCGCKLESFDRPPVWELSPRWPSCTTDWPICHSSSHRCASDRRLQVMTLDWHFFLRSRTRRARLWPIGDDHRPPDHHKTFSYSNLVACCWFFCARSFSTAILAVASEALARVPRLSITLFEIVPTTASGPPQ